jgi:(2S)-methylsuccinyl-CoA dehydrogenase
MHAFPHFDSVSQRPYNDQFALIYKEDTMPISNEVQAALDACQKLCDQVAAHLASVSSEGGKVSTEKLDQHQLAAYEFAYMVAETQGAKEAFAYLERANRWGTIDEDVSHIFLAETVQNLRNRVYARPASYGLTTEQIVATLDAPAVRGYSDANLAPAKYEAVAKLLADGQVPSYGLGEDHEAIRDPFRKFAQDKVMPLAEKIHRHDLLVPEDIIQGLAEMGCFGLSIPEEYGGFQTDNIGMVVVTEELSRGSLAAAGSLITRPEILSKALLKGGTEEQKQEWLPKLASAEEMGGVAVTEPDFGSDVAGLKVMATKVDGGWRINGTKTWCTFAGRATVLLVLARTNPDMKLKHKGLSILLAQKPAFDGHDFEHKQEEGGTISGRAIATLGYRGMHSYEVNFDNYFVPDKNLVGGEKGLGQGFYLQMEGFAGGRLQTAARALGVMQASYESGMQYAQERKIFGQPEFQYPLTQYKLARMAMLIHVCRQFTYAAARLVDEHKGQMESSLVKLFSCRMAEWVAREAMQIHGGMGYAEEFAVSRYYVDARVLSIFEGAEEVLALRVVARNLVEAALKA